MRTSQRRCSAWLCWEQGDVRVGAESQGLPVSVHQLRHHFWAAYSVQRTVRLHGNHQLSTKSSPPVPCALTTCSLTALPHIEINV